MFGTKSEGNNVATMVRNTIGKWVGLFRHPFVANLNPCLKKQFLAIFSTVALVAAITTTAHAQTGISVQFEGAAGGGNTPGVLRADQNAGAYPLNNWNVDDQGSGGTQANLKDSTGTATAASITALTEAAGNGRRTAAAAARAPISPGATLPI
jgi:hypothetical protein